MNSKPTLKIGILGAGAIGQIMAKTLDRWQGRAVVVGLADQDREHAEKLAAKLKNAPPVVSVDQLVASADLIVEAASQAALPDLVPKALECKKDLLIMSVGGLLGHDEWFRKAEEQGCRIHIPSGAIAGLDGLRAASMGRLSLVILTSRKPVAALKGTKYVTDRGIDLDRLKEETVIFEGPPEEACAAFPATSNVAASLRLSVGKSVEVRVRVLAVPGGTQNVHEIQATGDFGRFRIVLENVPSDNPRTSRLAALSALATLDSIVRGSQIIL